MKSLWFKARYVDDIRDGEKRSTMRKRSSRHPGVGEIVALSVGPRVPFAYARLTAVQQLAWVDLDEAKRSELVSLGYCPGVDLTRLEFECLDDTSC